MTEPTVGVVGCGYWGKNLVRNFAQLGALKHVCDSNPDRLREQVCRYDDNVRATTSFEELLADDGLTAVVIATPAACHYEHARRALEHDKHVFVEKPLAIRLHDGRELVALAEARDRILMVGHILEYHPAIKVLKDLVETGELGEVWYIYSNRLNLGKVRREENILWSFAPHDISLILGLAGGEPVSLQSYGANYLQPDVVDVTTTNIEFDNGVHAHIFVSWLHPFKEQRLVVIGNRKMAVFDDTAREEKLKVFDKGIEWRDGLPVTRQTAETTLFIEETEPLLLECQHFLECLESGRQPITDGHNGLAVLRILEASQVSLENGSEMVSLDGFEGT